MAWPLVGPLLVLLSWTACPALPVRAATIGLNFTGVEFAEGLSLNGGGYAPPDNAGGVGPAHVVQLINGVFAVYDKGTGAVQQQISAKQFWTNAGFAPGSGPGNTNLGVFNQRILYDPASDRWIAAALTGESMDNRVLLARSETSNPLGAWKSTSFLGNSGGDGRFVDYTGLGIDADGVYVSTVNYTENSVNGGLTGASLFSLPKADLLAPVPGVGNLTRFDEIDVGQYGISIQPIVNLGPSTGRAPFLGTTIANVDTYLYRGSLTGTAGPIAGLDPGVAIPVAEYSLPPAAAQPDLTRSIDTIDHRISAHAYQVGDVIYAVHATKVGFNAALHWVKIRESTNEVIQEGIISDPNFDYYQPSIGANAAGDVVISFNRSGFFVDGNISVVAVVGSTAGDLTTFGTPMVLRVSTADNYHYVNSRWGDWTSTVVDPSNPLVFWTFQEFAIQYTLSNGSVITRWATQVTQLTVPEPGSMALAAMGLAALVVAARGKRRAASAAAGANHKGA